MAKPSAKRGGKSLRTAKQSTKRGTNPNSLANLEAHKFEKGVSGNPGGRPRIMSDAYKEWLSLVQENDPQKRTNAQIGAAAIGLEMMKGDVSAAREIRSSTEGDTVKLKTWQSEFVDALKAGNLSAQEVIDAVGIDEGRNIIIAAGLAVPTSAPER